MPNAHYVSENPHVRAHLEELPKWQRDIVTELTGMVATMTQGSQTENELLQRAWARVKRRKLRRH